jgi:hypothetical protein
LPRRIVTAWYTGVVGEGARARCITFETSLMHQIVADRLNPPSYCHGVMEAGWTFPPEEDPMADQLSADIVVIGSGICG